MYILFVIHIIILLQYNKTACTSLPEDEHVDVSVEIPTSCSFVIEFIIPEFIDGSTCFERHTVHHQVL
jgi:hypothetical protein